MAIKKPRTKQLWTVQIDDAINYYYERRILNYRDFLTKWCEVFGEDIETELNNFQNGIDDRLTLGIIDRCFDMGVIENFRYIDSLKRLARKGVIQYNKKNKKWRVTS